MYTLQQEMPQNAWKRRQSVYLEAGRKAVAEAVAAGLVGPDEAEIDEHFRQFEEILPRGAKDFAKSDAGTTVFAHEGGTAIMIACRTEHGIALVSAVGAATVSSLIYLTNDIKKSMDVELQAHLPSEVACCTQQSYLRRTYALGSQK
jgi:hypothetical protein